MSEYEIALATDNPPTFVFDEAKASDEEVEYVLAYLLLLQVFYDTYKHKSVDYVIANVEKDIKRLEKDYLKLDKQLDTFYDDTRKETALEACVVSGKLNKVKIDNNRFMDLKSEQNFTSLAITGALALGLLSSAYTHRSRKTKELFNIDTNFKQAVTRTINKTTYAYSNAKSIAQTKTLEFLYDDPMMEWITEDDEVVCDFCYEIEYASPMKLSEMPETPLHPNCRCKRRLYDDNSLTARALNLIFY